MNSNPIHRLQTLRVRDVMNKAVVNISASQKMSEVAASFLDSGVSSAPVVDEQGRCVGILSATDFLRRDSSRQGGHGGSSSGQELLLTDDDVSGALHIESALDDAVASFMSGSVQSIASDAPLLTAAKIMCAEHIHRLPVLDSDERPIGVVSTMDIVAALLGAIDEMQSTAKT